MSEAGGSSKSETKDKVVVRAGQEMVDVEEEIQEQERKHVVHSSQSHPPLPAAGASSFTGSPVFFFSLSLLWSLSFFSRTLRVNIRS